MGGGQRPFDSWPRLQDRKMSSSGLAELVCEVEREMVQRGMGGQDTPAAGGGGAQALSLQEEWEKWAGSCVYRRGDENRAEEGMDILNLFVERSQPTSV